MNNDFVVGFETVTVSVSDGYTNWQIEFPSKYYLMTDTEYISDWKNFKSCNKSEKTTRIIN